MVSLCTNHSASTLVFKTFFPLVSLMSRNKKNINNDNFAYNLVNLARMTIFAKFANKLEAEGIDGE